MINKNKYQEALDKLCSRCYVESDECTCHARYKGGKCYDTCDYRDALQELINQQEQTQPTFEECVKEWNDWGYEFYEGKNHIHFRQRNDYDDYVLYDEYIFHPIKKYYVANNTKVTFEMFQLIIKTMKALEVSNNE